MAVQRRQRDVVKVDEADAADAGAGEHVRRMAAHAAEADDDDEGLFQLRRKREGWGQHACRRHW